jgi:uncharacterized protein
VDQNKLKEELDNTVIRCVNSVGININTASKHLIELMVEWEEAGRKH